MSIALQLPRAGAAPPLCDVHHLPCHLAHDGSAKVSTYFLPRPAAGSGGGLAAHLRGRALAGLEAALPAGVEGAVFRELQGSELVSAAAASAAAAAAAAAALGASSSSGGGGGGEAGDDDDECEGLFGGGGMGSDGEGSGYGQGSDEGEGSGGFGSRKAAGGARSGAAAAAAAAAATPAAAGAAGRPSGRVWALDARFTKVTTWQHDTPATVQDMLPRALEWMRVAAALHSY